MVTVTGRGFDSRTRERAGLTLHGNMANMSKSWQRGQDRVWRLLPDPETTETTEEKEMAKTKTTISVNGGPEVPLDVLEKAMDVVDAIHGKPAAEVHRERYTSDQECVLTTDERLARAKELTNTFAEKDHTEESLAAMKSQYKSKLEAFAATISKLVQIIASGREFRTVECWREWRYDTREVVCVRGDTAEVIERRPMRKDELQMDLEKDAAPAPEETATGNAAPAPETEEQGEEGGDAEDDGI